MATPIEQLKKFKSERTSIKTSVTKFNTFLKTITDKEYTLNNFFLIETRLSKINPAHERFMQIQNEIEEFGDLIDPVTEETQTVQFETTYFDGVAKAKELMYEIKRANDVANTSIASTSTASTANTQSHTGPSVSSTPRRNVRLPKLNLPKFSGEVENWIEFRDIFVALIHTNDDLTAIEKFQFLRSAIEHSDAIVAIQGCGLSADGYDAAWQIISNRYDNIKRLLNSHINALVNFPPIVKETAHNLCTLIDTFAKHLKALQCLNEKTEHWDSFITFLIISKLNIQAVKEWETEDSGNERSKLADLTKFLQRRAYVLQTVECKQAEIKTQSHRTSTSSELRTTRFSKLHANFATVSQNKCPICSAEHRIAACPEFKNLSQEQRYDKTKQLRLCTNCLRSGHNRFECIGGNCQICRRKHHTLLHDTRKSRSLPYNVNTNHIPSLESSTSTKSNADATTSNVARTVNRYANVLLPTATVIIQDKFNNAHSVRALLDSGSQSNFITVDLCEKLKLPTQPLQIQLMGITQTPKNISSYCNVMIESRTGHFKTQAQCLVLHEITGTLPNLQFHYEGLNIPPNITLADPDYFKPRRIDMLIGVELFWTILSNESINLGPCLPILRNTEFGWVVGGSHQIPLTKATSNITVRANCVTIQEQLAKFWQIEEYDSKPKLTKEEEYCEDVFQRTTRRDLNGRFIVDLPFKRDPSTLGDSYEMAKRRFHSQENKLKLNDSKSKQYRDFMQEYINLKHMTETDPKHSNETCYYLPHHAVINENSNTTKLRVVFDASARTSTGIALNDVLCVGPTMQNDLVSILIRFRTHYYALSTDIKKMYRQVSVNENHRRFQRVLWRDDDSKLLKSYDLNTVTYGTAPASYLAIRCLYDLANSIADQYPQIATVIRNDFYVDNLITGASTLQEAMDIRSKIQQIFSAASMPLHSWVTNEPVLINCNTNEINTTLDMGKDENSNTLGLVWSTKSDCLSFKHAFKSYGPNVTKRQVLSQISQIFDPLGILAPIIITIKMILQELWLLKLGWDDVIPSDVIKPWDKFTNDIDCLKLFTIPRFSLLAEFDYIQLHGYADASEKAYAACIYLRTVHGSDNVSHLLIAKTRVAPLKTVTIPRLELCACVLMSRLVQKVISSLRITVSSVFLWTDSSIVLAWLKMVPANLKPFVSHRIAEIQTALPNAMWNHVRSQDNPADIASRGATYTQLLHDKLWWHGPAWLSLPQSEWPTDLINKCENLTVPELEVKISTTVATLASFFDFQKYSSITKIERILAFCSRFIYNCKHGSSRKTGPISYEEMNAASLVAVKIVQRLFFADEIKALAKGHDIKSSSNLIRLSPFIDAAHILRVGGRLKHSPYDVFAKHPAILPGKHYISTLIMRRAHIALMHIGPQGLLNAIRQRFWILSGRRLANKVVHTCMTCFKAKPKFIHPIMSDLPAERVTPSHPFLHCGVDYAGPIFLKTSNNRGNKKYKAYICIFLCLATKAVHLELITSLTTDAFIASLRRFVSRRGVPHTVLSDNGTNFVGANRELKELAVFVSQERQTIIDKAARENISWRFSPPRAPHFGGIWEAGVKSLKFHIKRVVGERTLTYEDFATLLNQVEAILNSRPLSPLSSNPNDYAPLTPAHFLIGRPFNAIPDMDLDEVPEARLSTFQRIQSIYQHFWKRWSLEYLNQLQPRKKWERGMAAKILMPGTLVLIAEDNLPPLCWKMARIVDCHPGKDGIVRVVTLKTSSSTFQRPAVKVCPLPIYDNSPT